MKKILALTSAVLLAATMLVGCAAKCSKCGKELSDLEKEASKEIGKDLCAVCLAEEMLG